MDEKKEIISMEKIINNPIAKNFMAIYRTIIPFGDLIDTNVNIVINKFMKEKHELLLNRILSNTETICTIDINDVEFIMNFKKTLDAVNRLSNNDKVIYFANLLKNGYLTNNRISNDEYEEYLRTLNELSFREINYIFFLYKFELNNNKEDKKYWYKFMDEFEKEFKINKYRSYEIYKRISNTGLIYEELQLEGTSVLEKSSPEEYDTLITDNIDLKYFSTTDFLNKLIKLIEK